MDFPFSVPVCCKGSGNGNWEVALFRYRLIAEALEAPESARRESRYNPNGVFFESSPGTLPGKRM